MGRPLTSADDPSGFGGYRLLSRLGEGGMGVVYLAETPGGKQVALKAIRPQLAAHEEFRIRFRSEVALARKVARFCTAPILDSDTDADPPYVVTEFIDGPTLAEVVTEHGPLTGSQLHALGVGMASALTAIHRAGIVHRDLKPSNVVLSRFGPRVIDFGIARAVDGVTGLTSTGQFVGSPSYMAPEQFRPQPVTPAADIFAWGAVMAFAGTGQLPFGAAVEAVMYRVVFGEPDLDGLDPAVADVVRSALRKEPAERPTARRLLEILVDMEGGAEGLPVPLADPSAVPVASGDTTRVAAPPAAPPAAPAGAAGGGAAEPTAALPTHASRPGRVPGRRRRWLAAVAVGTVGVLAGAAALSDTLLRSDEDTARSKPSPPAQTMESTPPVRYDDRAIGPAPFVPGAVRGGTVTSLQSSGWRHLDPQRNYRAEAMSAGAALLFRSLTGYVHGDDGQLRLVGDLATDTGKTSDGGRTWTYRLRPGLRFEDGTPITSTDVAYGVARSFAAEVSGGPTYLQNWLVGSAGEGFRQRWPGPYRSTSGTLPPGVTVPDPQTIVFAFAAQHPEFPMVAALGTTSPVPAAKDTRGGYDAAPMASGPYRIRLRTADRLELERNPHWNPRTDPIRPAYPDRWVLRSGVDPSSGARRLLTDAPGDRTTFAWSNLPAALARQASEGAAGERVLRGPSPFTEFLAVNTRRVTDVRVRKAISAAIDRRDAVKILLGAAGGTPSTTVLSSALPGYRHHNGLGVGPNGDPRRARQLLGDSTPPRLTYAHSDTADQQRLAAYIADALTEVGFTVRLEPIPADRYYAAIKRRDNPYDLYHYVWGTDIPDATGVFSNLFARTAIAEQGGTNVSLFDDLAVSAEIDRLQSEPDRAKAAAGYAQLDERLLRDHAPVVPLFERRQLSLRGSRLGGLSVNRVFGTVGLENVHVRR